MGIGFKPKKIFRAGKKAIESPLKKIDKNLEKFSKKLGPVGETLYQVGDATKEGLVEGVIKNPSRLLTGVDPVSSKSWNGILGTNKKSLVSVTGGPTNRTLDKFGAGKLTRGVFKVANSIDMYVGTLRYSTGLGEGLQQLQILHLDLHHRGHVTIGFSRLRTCATSFQASFSNPADLL
jgi:hypothetical protein